VTLTMYARQLADKTLMNYTRWGKAGCDINNACEAVSRCGINDACETVSDWIRIIQDGKRLDVERQMGHQQCITSMM
jgi:hypothetical protein